MNDPVDLLLSATEDSIHNGTEQKDKELILEILKQATNSLRYFDASSLTPDLTACCCFTTVP